MSEVGILEPYNFLFQTMNEDVSSATITPETAPNNHLPLYIGLGVAVAVLVLVVLGYIFGGGVFDRLDANSFYWSPQKTADSSALFSGDALVLVTKKAHPDLPLLASVDFATRTITSLVDLTTSGGGVSSARLLPSKSRIAVTTLGADGLSKVEVTDVRGHAVAGDEPDKGDTNTIRYNVDWSPTNQFVATGILPTALLGSDKVTDVHEWGTYISSLFAPTNVLLPGSFSPAFSSDGKSVFVLAAAGVGAIKIPDSLFFTKEVASTTEIVAKYPEGLTPAAMVFSQDRRTAVVTYLNSSRADVYSVTGDPASFTLVSTLKLDPVQVPFLGASSIAVSGSHSLVASQVAAGRVSLTLKTASSSQMTLKLPHDVTRVSVAELMGGSVLKQQ